VLRNKVYERVTNKNQRYTSSITSKEELAYELIAIFCFPGRLTDILHVLPPMPPMPPILIAVDVAWLAEAVDVGLDIAIVIDIEPMSILLK
jgi:hypothetical protein